MGVSWFIPLQLKFQSWIIPSHIEKHSDFKVRWLTTDRFNWQDVKRNTDTDWSNTIERPKSIFEMNISKEVKRESHLGSFSLVTLPENELPTWCFCHRFPSQWFRTKNSLLGTIRLSYHVCYTRYVVWNFQSSLNNSR